MKIVSDQMQHYSTFVNNLEVNSIQKHDSMTHVDQLRGDVKIFPEDLSNSICHKNNAGPSPVEMIDYIMDLPGDGWTVVKESQTEVGFDDPLEICPPKIRAETYCGIQYSGETDGSSIRDICIDKGLPANDRFLVEDITDGHKCLVEDSSPANALNYASDNVKVEGEWPMVVGSKSMTDEASEKEFNSCYSKVLTEDTYASESEPTVLVSSDPKDKDVNIVITEDIYAEKSQSKIYTENKQNIRHQESVAEFEDATEKLICSSSTPETTVKETAVDSTVETSVMKTYPAQEATIDILLPAAVDSNEVELPPTAFHPQIPEQQNLASDHLTASSRIQEDHFESSFASLGPYTNSIAYSGSVACSGSLSHRSDASTVSNRSFAFPVLQNEWNFSPVRMRKADRRLLGRRRGWMNGLFCCKF